MDDLRISGRQYDAYQTPQPYSILPGGVLPVSDWIMALIMRGYGWHFDVGGDVTGITGGGAGTVYDLEQPEFVISVPSGYTCIPYDVLIAAQPGLQTTDSHVVDLLLAVDRTQKWNGTGTFTAETPTNNRTDISAGCPLSVASAFTADITTATPVEGMELARWTGKTDFQGTPADSIIRSAILHYKPLRPPLVVGPAMVIGRWMVLSLSLAMLMSTSWRSRRHSSPAYRSQESRDPSQEQE